MSKVIYFALGETNGFNLNMFQMFKGRSLQGIIKPFILPEFLWETER